MLTDGLKKHLEERFSFAIKSIQPLRGGDINSVYHLKCRQSEFVVKINKANVFPNMFQKEANGLSALRTSQAIDVPEVIGFGNYGSHTYLAMEYKPSGQDDQNFWVLFGQQLANLHQNTQKTFGFMEDNYIGSLPQYNAPSTAASCDSI